MSGFGNDGIALIARALLKAAGMHVYIGHNFQGALPTVFPHTPELTAIKFHDAVCKASLINVVIVEELMDPSRRPVHAT